MQEVPRRRALLRVPVPRRQRRLERPGRVQRIRRDVVDVPEAEPGGPLPRRTDGAADGPLVLATWPEVEEIRGRRRRKPCKPRPRQENSSVVSDISDDPTVMTTMMMRSRTKEMRSSRRQV